MFSSGKWKTALLQSAWVGGRVFRPRPGERKWFPVLWGGSSTWRTNFIYTDANGGKHPLAIQTRSGGNCATGQDLQGPDLTGQGIWAKLPFIGSISPDVFHSDGTMARLDTTQAGPWKDSNGNLNGEGFDWKDTLGRTIVTNLVVYDSNGQPQNYTVNYASINVSTSFGVNPPGPGPGATEYTGSYQVISSIVLPNGRSYQFQYENGTYGALTRIDLPTGGYITYTWATIADGTKTHRYVASRTVNVDGQNHTWLFSRSGTDGFFSVTVTDPLGNQSTYGGVHGSITGASFYSGEATGTPLRRYSINYASDADPWEDTSIVNTEDPEPYEPQTRAWRPVSATTTLEDGRVSKKEFDYETFTYAYHARHAQVYANSPTTFTTSRSNVSEIREYDFGAVPGTYGQGVAGPLVRKTTKTYLHNSNTTYKTYNVVDKVLTNTILDGAGAQKARVEFEYDTTAITPTSSVPQHDYVSHPSTFTYRGNVSKVKRWRNSDGALLTTTYVYDDLGNIRTVTDPLSHTTSVSYTDAWANTSCPPPANSLAYATQVTNHLGHRMQFTYYPCTGLVRARKDENDILAGRSGVTSSYDLLGRLTQQDFPDGGQAIYAYTDTTPLKVQTTRKINATQNLLSELEMDGLGRQRFARLLSDPQGTVFTETIYDALGRVWKVTNPFRTTSDATYGITESVYDALGRVIKVIPPDGTSASNNIVTAYAGNTVTVTDHAGKQRRTYADALGRLVRVDEPAQGLVGGTPGAGSVTVSGSEQSTMVNQPYWGCILWWEGQCWEEGWIDNWVQVYDTGSVSITVNGLTQSATYGQSSTASTIATALRTAINGDSGYPVTAAGTGAVVSLTAKTNGAATNYSLSASSLSNDPANFTPPSFAAAASGSTLTGGTDGTPGGTPSISTPAVTLYTYDTLDNLTCVVQKGPDAAAFSSCGSAPATWRPRTFTYNSLSQLLTAVNPESGTISYTYDSDGNLLTKTDARSITTTYAYDVLHRITTKTYSDGTPTATYTYDLASVDGLSIQNPVGKLVKSATSNTRTVQSYDTVGRVVRQWQCTPLNCGSSFWQMDYAYDLSGGTTSFTNGMGTTFTQGFDTAGRVQQLTSSWNDAQHPGTLVSGIGYHPHGTIAQMDLGNGLREAQAFSNRLQPTEMRTYNPGTQADTLKLAYGFNHGTSNNGNVMSWAASGSAQTFTRSYTYDELNRLKTMASTGTCTGLSWTYDIWGNRTHQTITGGTCGQSQLTINTLNRIADAGFSYDASGNLIAEPGKTYQYDAENRMKSLNTTSATYAYNAEGRRVQKIVSGAQTNYVYDLTGNVVAEMNASGGWMVGYVYLGGKLVAQYRDSTTYFVHKDHLGSSRVLTRLDKSAYDSLDYLPYGEQIAGDTGTTHKFTGKERDAESGLDYFGARYYGSSLGRFMTTDPLDASAHPAYPQSWNRYSYAFNNPLKFIDVKGKCSSPAVGAGQVGICVSLYISSRTINGLGFGDNRGPRSDGGTYRAEMHFVVDPKKGSVAMTKNDAGTSRAILPLPPVGAIIQNKGTSETKPIQPTTDDKGTTRFEVSNTALGGLSFLSVGGVGAPADPIKTDLNLVVTQDGEVGVDGGLRTAYPSLEIWSYDEKGNATPILQIQETKSEDLKKKDQVVPKIEPKK